MKIRVLGSSAGGGLPQWNCGCENCVAARSGSSEILPRSQSSLAVSVDGNQWVLFNASPDVRTQLASFAPTAPPSGSLRGSRLAAVVLTNGDIDHCAGLLVLREGGAPPIYCTARVKAAITEGLSILPVLEAYGPVHWRELIPSRETMVAARDGTDTGVRVRPFTVASKPPPYMLRFLGDGPRDDHAGDTVGIVLRGKLSKNVVYVPGVRDLDSALTNELRNADVILIDGTFFTDDELVARGASTKTAHMMGHAPLDGSSGLLAYLGQFTQARRVLVHINNSNPILDPHSSARKTVERAGVEVSADGMELEI